MSLLSWNKYLFSLLLHSVRLYDGMERHSGAVWDLGRTTLLGSITLVKWREYKKNKRNNINIHLFFPFSVNNSKSAKFVERLYKKIQIIQSKRCFKLGYVILTLDWVKIKNLTIVALLSYSETYNYKNLENCVYLIISVPHLYLSSSSLFLYIFFSNLFIFSHI